MVLKNILFWLATHYSLGLFTIFTAESFLWMLKHFCFFTTFALCAFSTPYNLCIKTLVNPSPQIKNTEKIQCGHSLSSLQPFPILSLIFGLVWVFLSLHLAFFAIPNSEIASSHSLVLKIAKTLMTNSIMSLPNLLKLINLFCISIKTVLLTLIFSAT